MGAERLVEDGLHLRKGPQEHQILVDGVDLPPHLQAGHLGGGGGGDMHTRSLASLPPHLGAPAAFRQHTASPATEHAPSEPSPQGNPAPCCGEQLRNQLLSCASPQGHEGSQWRTGWETSPSRGLTRGSPRERRRAHPGLSMPIGPRAGRNHGHCGWPPWEASPRPASPAGLTSPQRPCSSPRCQSHSPPPGAGSEGPRQERPGETLRGAGSLCPHETVILPAPRAPALQ